MPRSYRATTRVRLPSGEVVLIDLETHGFLYGKGRRSLARIRRAKVTFKLGVQQPTCCSITASS